MSTIDQHQVSKVFGIALFVFLLSACAGSPPDNLGIKEGKLAPCPSSPNCVSSYALSKEHFMAPWKFQGSRSQGQAKLYKILSNMPDVTIVSKTEGYIRAEFESSLMGFVDDVEFVIGDGMIHFRSASRLGYHDLGANEARITALKDKFLPCCAQ